MSSASGIAPRTFSPSWPAEPCTHRPAEFARRFVLHLSEALGSCPTREVEQSTGVEAATLSRILDGHAWPDGRTVACLEIGLQRALWPRHHC